MVLNQFAFPLRPRAGRATAARGLGRLGLLLCASALLTTAAAAQEAPSGGADLRGQVSDPQAQRFYSARGWREVWTEEATQALHEALDAAPRHGLSPQRYLDLLAPSEDPARRDAALTRAALAYAQALAHGAVNPLDLHEIVELHGNNVDVVAGLSQALERGELRSWLDSLPPQDAEYQALSRAYLAAIWQPAGEAIADGPLIRPGKADPRLPAIARQLQAKGYLDEAGEPEVFDPELVEAVRRLQADAGLNADGIIGPATLKALGGASAERARQLAVNLERRRWLARRPPATRIDVNIALANLAYIEDGEVAWSGRTVVGEPKRPTPMLEDSFNQLVVNPPWNVPQRIAAEEILPQGESYLQRNNMVVQDGRVIQKPGPDAALGLVKFDMQNEHAIYLHDTPAKALFASDQRQRSHGCVRVEKAVEFARFLAERHGAAETFEPALASGETKVVALTSEIRVRLFYHSAVMAEDGRVQLGPDPYGWDARVAEALGLGGEAPDQAESPAEAGADLGP